MSTDCKNLSTLLWLLKPSARVWESWLSRTPTNKSSSKTPFFWHTIWSHAETVSSDTTRRQCKKSTKNTSNKQASINCQNKEFSTKGNNKNNKKTNKIDIWKSSKTFNPSLWDLVTLSRPFQISRATKRLTRSVLWPLSRSKGTCQKKGSVNCLSGLLLLSKASNFPTLLFPLHQSKPLWRFWCGSKATPFTTASSWSSFRKKAKRSEMIIKNWHLKNCGHFSTSRTCTPKSLTLSFLSADFSLMNSLKLSKGLLPKLTLHKSKPQFRDFPIFGDSLDSSTRSCSFPTGNSESSIRWACSWCWTFWTILIPWSDMQQRIGSWKAFLCSVESLIRYFTNW